MNDMEIAVLKVQLDAINKTIEEIKNDINSINKHNSRVIIAVIIASQTVLGGGGGKVIDYLVREPAFISTQANAQCVNPDLK